jgi:hypothetical protein
VNKKLKELMNYLWWLFVSGIALVSNVNNAYAFTKLKNGFETITSTYLIPLSTAVAGASFILFVILSYFKQEEYQKKVGNVLALSILSVTGLEIINSLVQSFS